ncbi:membrane protein [Commensalibacter intestini]|uniref:Membrane protein n=1 Tax=Commensalibacter intestini TaxID=479936 RepID=A0A251ZXS9_9PROT|nr:membrane protein [Commensalibacter intestini]
MSYFALVFLKFIVGFIIVICYFNYSGKTQISQMSPIDLIGNFILGGIIGGVIYSDTIPLYTYVIVLIIGTFLMHLLNKVAKKFELFRSFTLGDPIIIVKNGQLMVDTINNKQNKIDIINLLSILHARGIGSIQEVHYAQVEPNGQLTIIEKDQNEPSIVLILRGEIQRLPFELLETDDQYISHLLENNQLKLEEIFIAEYYSHRIIITLDDGKKITVPVALKSKEQS